MIANQSDPIGQPPQASDDGSGALPLQRAIEAVASLAIERRDDEPAGQGPPGENWVPETPVRAVGRPVSLSAGPPTTSPTAPVLATAALREKASPDLLALLDELDARVERYQDSVGTLVDFELFSAEDRSAFWEVRRRTRADAITGSARKSDGPVRRLIGHISRLTEEHLRRLSMHAESAPIVSLADRLAPPATTDEERGPDPSDPIHNAPIRSAWGRAAELMPQPEVGQAIGEPGRTKGGRNALARATLLSPVLLGMMTPGQASKYWRLQFSEVLSTPGQHGAYGLSREICRKYLRISTRALERWRSRVLSDAALGSMLSFPARAAQDVLTQRYSTAESSEVDPDVVRVRETFLANPLWKAPQVALAVFGDAVTHSRLRMVRQTIREIPAWERLLHRGGALWEDALRSRLLRNVDKPGAVWLLDHLFVSQEITGKKLYRPHDGRYAAFGRVDLVVERQRGARAPERRRVKGLYITMVVDMCTRRRLVLRVWDCVPTTQMTMLALRDAVERFGRPDVLYTDNGSDLTSAHTRTQLLELGIKHVFSRAYDPRGRGIIERSVRTLKERLIPLLPGYCPPGTNRKWDMRELLTVTEFETVLWNYVERFINNSEHWATRRKPTEHYESEIGARGLDRVDASLWLPLLQRATTVRADSGILLAGVWYASPRLFGVPIGNDVEIFYDRFRPKHVHAALPPAAGGTPEYLGILSRVGGPDLDDKPPTPWDLRERERAWFDEFTAMTKARTRKIEVQDRIAEARAEGETAAAEDLLMVKTAQRSRRRLAARSASAADKPEGSAAPASDEQARLKLIRESPTADPWNPAVS